MVAMFLHVLAHDVKNRIIQREFVRSGETVSRHFNLILLAVVRLYEELIKRPIPVTNNCNDQQLPWRVRQNVHKGETSPQQISLHSEHCRGAGNAPTNTKEYFNMKHSLTRNVIECTFSVLKGCWTILRGKSYYPLQVQCRTILACCLLHNLINREMTYCNDVDDVDEEDSTYVMTTASEDIHYIKTTNEWSQWRDELAESMFTDCQLRNA
ncbi:retrotransposon protein [Cucumis melo var. makuwa]|uniref:Retrotransposon protein n=1 Tax=Cucumis melo var. makuwa TaxID=1194695 RepID=A0A5D3CP63_CUCMM|nr:retrotransposon protein [Cucumis melo var. makuwa]TYK12079.1 retrotransposon protein [Cucumis melo var. makuwa]